MDSIDPTDRGQAVFGGGGMDDGAEFNRRCGMGLIDPASDCVDCVEGAETTTAASRWAAGGPLARAQRTYIYIVADVDRRNGAAAAL